MHMTLRRRAFWLLFAFWFGPSIVVPETLYQCPVHHAGLLGEAGHASHAAMRVGNETPTEPSSHTACTCLDQGCASSHAALTAAAWHVVATVAFVRADNIAFSASSVRGSQADVLLPPSTGPPPRV